MQAVYADVIIDISHEKVDRPFQYRIPEHLLDKVTVGCKVTVPFGRGNTSRTGYVLAIGNPPEWEESRMKEISEVCDKSITAEDNLIALAAYMKETFGSTMIAALKTVLPVKKVTKAVEHKTVHALKDEKELQLAAFNAASKHRRAQARLLEALCESPEIAYPLVTGKLNVSPQTVQSLEKQGYCKVVVTTEYRNPIRFRDENRKCVSLNPDQQKIVDSIEEDRKQKKYGTYLIHGVTGSGKTEVYMELISKCVESGKQAIMLIPEISLTYQTVSRFYQRFGDQVSVIHSRLSEGERFDQFERAKKGEVTVMIGPRSALFTPFPNTGLIVIDEEHESTYKSETSPKYHAREVAIYLAKKNGAQVILGSATPSLESYTRAKRGEYTLFELGSRATANTLPTVHITDMRKEFEEGNKSIFSRLLQNKIEDRLEKGEQTMLFLNRRGYAGFISCRSCGEVIKCPHCDVSLSEHRDGKLYCHYCGFEQRKVTKCPACSSPYIAGFKAGTQQIEELILKQFPTAVVLRMDADTTKNKDDYEKILSRFSNREADILLGTQMIVKGHDFSGVTLMGILAADLSLNGNDYRSGERTFQLLTQAAGRAGRGEIQGEVVFQTYQPEHYAITASATQDYKAFYEEEMLYREMLLYPPAAELLAVQLTGPDEKGIEALAAKLALQAESMALQDPPVRIGPAKAALGKKKDLYRQVIYYKHKDYETLIQVKNEMERYLNTLQLRRENVQFDFNPMHMF